MSDTKLEDEYFDFNGVFPECTDGFDWDTGAFRGRGDANKFTTLCSGLNLKLTTENRSTEFSQLCRVLGLYLKHIETNKNEHAQRCCKLFYYKLKKDIMDKFNLKCNDAKSCYLEMANHKANGLDTQISDICLKHLIHIDGDTFKIMEYLFEIYNKVNLFNTNNQRTTSNMHKFKEYIEKLEIYFYKYRSEIKEELGKIIKICEGYISEWEADKRLAKHASDLLKYDNWINTRKRKLEEEEEENTRSDWRPTETLESKVLYAKAIMIPRTDDYTHYFSFLKPSVRKLRSMFNKNNKNNMDLMYSFDVEYKNSIDDRYKIAYS
ncbi:variable surface protein [Plasmodium gonderi]|uniref:Variable surface protein n=1 Tax=Plasmodium gonderi TaxID=77519 RepID=A0A1Y1JN53_PLAGO|nr:variable surface protein [Plasmodium gonderi]GAW83909.1 variable surface protein [Plasmodium gonderi]